MSSAVASSTSLSLLVVHAHWSDGALHLWAEGDVGAGGNAGSDAALPAAHPHTLAASAEQILAALAGPLSGIEVGTGSLSIALPARGNTPLPSPHLAHALGHVEVEAETEAPEALPTLGRFRVPTLTIKPGDAPRVLDAMEDLTSTEVERGVAGGEQHVTVAASESLLFLAAASRFVRHLLAQHRVVPMIQQDQSGSVAGVWAPWLGDEQTAARAARLLAAMPASSRAAVDSFGHDGWTMIDDFILRIGDAICRRVLVQDTMKDAIEGRDAATDLHVTWLTGLLDQPAEIDVRTGPRNDLIKGVRRWIGGLEERGSGAAWRLLVKLSEPLDLKGVDDFATPGDKVRWTLSLHLQSVPEPTVIADATDIWLLPPGAASVEGQRIEQPQELLLSELGRAARLYKRLEKVLEESEPTELELTTTDAYKFLREIRPLLIEQGFGVVAPDWWDSPTVRLGARMLVQSDDIDLTSIGAGDENGGIGSTGSGTPQLGLASLVSYRWQIAVGDTNLTLEQFEKLAAQHSPLIRLNGRWVEIRPEDVKAAIKFIRENPGGKMEIGRALRLAYASDVRDTGVPILGMDATGWVAAVFGDASANTKMPMIEAPHGFIGTLRAYQLKGLSWLAFLDKLGLGACLADDMGLGKTIQLLALLAHERKFMRGSGTPPVSQDSAVPHIGGRVPSEDTSGTPVPLKRIPPTLLIVPMSVVSNWVHEARRFTPDLKVMIHHGLERKSGESLVNGAHDSDMVITTYALAHRDREDLSKVTWGRIVLDEAQNIKNPTAKQTRAIHAIPSPRRFALTGTPLENRLIELWSIMDFLNPGYLGPASEFRSKFAVPIERYHDKQRGSQLRGLVQPFVLRRLKTDPTVITDLPEKVESKEYCYLTPEQAGLYQTCVSDMLAAAERAEGIQRRGLVLAGLIKLKQICNHPAHFLKEFGPEKNAANAAPIVPSRSGKCQRINEMLQEIVAAGDKALVFTQFREMAHLLATMLRQTLDRDVLLLHGGTPAGQRTQIISDFQGDKSHGYKPTARSTRANAAPVLILSLKAGGVGLNLTAANHVFHFDRWWNPAVESQATDRAYRIGQTRTVQVHKFIVSGTLEERIDQMIEEKTQLADSIIGHGEQWLTELSTSQLRDLLTLRADAVEPDAEELVLP